MAYHVTMRVMEFDTKDKAYDFQEIMTTAFMEWKEAEGKTAVSTIEEVKE